MSENKKTDKIVVYTNIPGNEAQVPVGKEKFCEWFWDLQNVLEVAEYPIVLVYRSSIEELRNTSNVYFQCDAPNGKQIVAACNALFRSLLNLSMALGEYDNGD